MAATTGGRGSAAGFSLQNRRKTGKKMRKRKENG